MASQKKKDQVQNLAKILQESPNFALAKFDHPSHQTLETLRKNLKKTGAQFKVVKNALLEKAINKVAASNQMFDELRKRFFPLKEKTALLVFKNNWSMGLKTFYEFSQKEKNLGFKLALIDQSAYDETQVTAIAKLPSKQQLLANFAVMLKNPLTNFTYSLKFNPQKLVLILSAKAKRVS